MDNSRRIGGKHDNIRPYVLLGISSSTPQGTSFDVVDGLKTAVATGRRGVVIGCNNEYIYYRTSISTSNVKGEGWHSFQNGKFTQLSCSFRYCFAVDSSGKLMITGPFENTDSPSMQPMVILDSNVTDVSAYGTSTLWKIDKNGHTWQAVNIQSDSFHKVDWERRGFYSDSNVKLKEIAATDKIVVGVGASTGDLHILTGCPIFDFESDYLYDWSYSEKRMLPVYGDDSPSEWDKNGQVGERLFDTASTKSSKSTTPARDTTLKTTMTSPYFQIRRDTLHFLIGGGSPPNNYVSLIINNQEKRTASGGKQITHSYYKYADTWDYTSFDDFRASAPAFQGMHAYIDDQDAKAMYTTGSVFKQKLILTGFYASAKLPIYIDVVFRPKDRLAQIYFEDVSISWMKCWDRVEYSRNWQNAYHVKIKIDHLKFDAIYLLSLKVSDHKAFIKSKVYDVYMDTTVNHGSVFIMKQTKKFRVQRIGNETAKLTSSYGILSKKTVYDVGSTFSLRVRLYHDASKSLERAYNIFVRLQIPPYLSVEEVELNDKKGDRYYNHSISERIIKVKELLMDKSRSLIYKIKINGDTRWNIRDDRPLQGSLLLDVSYCVRENCTNINGTKKMVVPLVHNATEHIQFAYRNEKTRVQSMDGFATIVDKTGSLTFFCGPYEKIAMKVRHNCYYGYPNDKAWIGLNPMLSTITFYDSTTKELYGKNKKGIKMKFYGDRFEQHLFLSDEDWDIIIASSSSFSKPLNVNGVLDSTTATTVDGTLNGGYGYQLAVSGHGISSRNTSTSSSSSSSMLETKTNWRCCL
eukprot:Seg1055.3 transcript_id=Seg1055.3/GoldUCD/mRNA.D3Y31 product="hypothetical protein" protein_id=Seg1055.3/GoldUCD/D3Y31